MAVFDPNASNQKAISFNEASKRMLGRRQCVPDCLGLSQRCRLLATTGKLSGSLYYSVSSWTCFVFGKAMAKQSVEFENGFVETRSLKFLTVVVSVQSWVCDSQRENLVPS